MQRAAGAGRGVRVVRDHHDRLAVLAVERLEEREDLVTGLAVEKSEINAAHDGRIVQCPTVAIPGRAYQRVVDNRMHADLNLVEDLRTCTIGGKPVCVFIKRREVTKRFLNTNAEVLLRTPE